MRIVKVPDKLNIDGIVSERIDKVYQKCPFCYEVAINKTHDEKYADEFAREDVRKQIEAKIDGDFYRKFISKEEYVYSFESPRSFSCYSKTKPIEKGLFKRGIILSIKNIGAVDVTLSGTRRIILWV